MDDVTRLAEKAQMVLGRGRSRRREGGGLTSAVEAGRRASYHHVGDRGRDDLASQTTESAERLQPNG